MGNALSVWSGYLHQGIAALIVTIDKILELKEAGEDLERYKLSLESKEDFSISKDDGAGRHLSEEIHQVKAYARDKNMSAFSAAIAKLQVHHGAKKRYLHTMYPIPDWKVDGLEVLRYPYDAEQLHMGEAKAIEDFLLNRIEKLRGDANRGLALQASMNVQVQLNQRVTKEHREKKKVSMYDLKISLEDVLQWACGDTELHNAVLFKIRRDMRDHFDEFRDDTSGPFIQADPKHRTHLENLIFDLIGLDDLDFSSVLRMLSPHKKIQFGLSTNDLYIEEGWKQNFLILMTRVVNNPGEFHIGSLPLFKNNGEFYLPSFICDESSHRLKEKIEQNINAAGTHFEPDFIITRHPHSINFEVPGVLNTNFDDPSYVPPVGLRESRSERDIMAPKKVALIGRDEAINTLNS